MSNMVSSPYFTVISNAISGDYRIDMLLNGAESRWNYPYPLERFHPDLPADSGQIAATTAL